MVRILDVECKIFENRKASFLLKIVEKKTELIEVTSPAVFYRDEKTELQDIKICLVTINLYFHFSFTHFLAF